MPTPYQLAVEVHETYVHAKATGEHKPENALRFLGSPRNRDPAKANFAETVARNRGVNVRLFVTLEEAKTWLET
jgi:hypothetical protein